MEVTSVRKTYGPAGFLKEIKVINLLPAHLPGRCAVQTRPDCFPHNLRSDTLACELNR